jgi:ketosteroid isomerase-like protein
MVLGVCYVTSMIQVHNSPSAAVDDYLSAFYSGDFAAARSVVADEFTFEGPFITAESKESFFESAEGLRTIVRGHRTLRRMVDGNDVSTIYAMALETPVGAGSVTVSEWHHVRGGQLLSGHLFFDSAAFRALVPASS